MQVDTRDMVLPNDKPLDMVFKDNDTMMDFLYDLGEKLPSMFEFTSPQNPDELIRATEGGETIIAYKNSTLRAGEDILPVFLCRQFCSIIGKYDVEDIMANGD